jgi:hypothetical protein
MSPLSVDLCPELEPARKVLDKIRFPRRDVGYISPMRHVKLEAILIMEIEMDSWKVWKET